MPAPIRAVLFDVHQTLVHGGDPATWLDRGWSAAGRLGSPAAGWGAHRADAVCTFLDQIWEHAHLVDPDGTRDTGPHRHRRVFLRTVRDCPGVDPDLAESLYGVMLERWEVYEDTLPVLAALRGRGVATAVVSNVGFDIRPALDRHGVVVDAVVLSYEVGSVKPAPGIFTRAVDLVGSTPEETLMVGDSWRDDAGAAALGIRTLLLPRTDGPVHGLAAVLRLID